MANLRHLLTLMTPAAKYGDSLDVPGKSGLFLAVEYSSTLDPFPAFDFEGEWSASAWSEESNGGWSNVPSVRREVKNRSRHCSALSVPAGHHLAMFPASVWVRENPSSEEGGGWEKREEYWDGRGDGLEEGRPAESRYWERDELTVAAQLRNHCREVEWGEEGEERRDGRGSRRCTAFLAGSSTRPA